MKGVYLKKNVVAEPLFDSWYAWPHLISPATAAMNILDRHLKIIDSYLMSPAIHMAASKNPKMLGGPFMDFEKDETLNISLLKKNTLKRHAKKLEFAKAVHYLNESIVDLADGTSLDPVYEQIPEILKGYIELTYDVNNQPSFRFFESLLYNSEFYDPSAQSLAIYLIENDDRPFMLSTPRLPHDNVLFVDMSFDNQAIDNFFEARRIPKSYESLKKQFKITTKDREAKFKSLFTTEKPSYDGNYNGNGIRMRYFGHACILLEHQGVSILADPVISYGYDSEISRFSYKDLPDKIDFVIITHNHQDHILFETLLQIRHKTENVVVPKNNGSLQDPSIKLMFQKLGFKNVMELDELESIEFKGGKITGIPFLGEHADLDIRSKLCHLVELGNVKILFAADSCNVSSSVYEKVQAIIGNIDVFFLGMECDGAPLSWLYGPYLPIQPSDEVDKSRRLAGSNYDKGLDLVKIFNPKEVYVYAMGQEPWLNYIMALKYTEESNPIIASNRLLKWCNSNSIEAERLFGEKEIYYR